MTHAQNMANMHRSRRPNRLKPTYVSNISKIAGPGLIDTALALRLNERGELNVSRKTVAGVWTVIKHPHLGGMYPS